MSEQQSAYKTALDFIRAHPSTGGTTALSKCLLSMANNWCAFSLNEIAAPLDSKNSALLKRMISDYMDGANVDDLHVAAEWLYLNCEDMIEIARAQYEARSNLERKWRKD